MELTAMEPRRHRKTALFFDGEFALNIDTETLLKSGWKLGQEVSDEELHALIEAGKEHQASEKALYLLEHRSHSKKELTDKIARTVDRDAAQKAADHMEELGLLDDQDFGIRYAKELFRKGYARRRVMLELSRKGISQELIEMILEKNTPDPNEQIAKILQKRYQNLDDEKIRRRAYAALQRMGYETDEIRTALREAVNEEEIDGEFHRNGESGL